MAAVKVKEKSILYVGDTSLATAAAYVAGILSHYKLDFEYVPSDVSLNGQDLSSRKLFVISDYPSARMTDEHQHEIVQAVQRGAGLLMVGGWESFAGQTGDWAGTPIGQILPVIISKKDDRINCDQPALARCMAEHEICAKLPWSQRPPTIGGFNRLMAKDDATVVLEVERYTAKTTDGGKIRFDVIDRYPLLVVGQHGKGRTAALATDLAPHWVGGLVDWGTSKRVTAEAPQSWPIEVGDLYAQFVHNLIRWTGRLGSEKASKMPAATASAGVP